MKELISGKEAYFAIGKGLIVQKSYDPIGNGIFGEWEDLDPSVFNIYGMLKDSGNDPQFRFRLKLRTITLNGIEVPAPFEPKIGEKYWIIETSDKNSYSYISSFENDEQDESLTKLGAWRTEDEIKQVVAALRSIFKPQ